MKHLTFLFFIFSILKSTFLLSQNTLVVNSDSSNKYTDLDPYVSYFFPDTLIPIDSILKNKPEFTILELNRNNHIVNESIISKNGCWLKFKIKNNSDLNLQYFYGVSTNKVKKLYEFNGRIYIEKISGKSIPSSKRAYTHGNKEFLPFNISPNKENTYYVFISNTNESELTIPHSDIFPSKFVLKANRKSNYYIGIFIGIIIIILFTNLILFWSTKDSTYIYYCAYLFFAGSLILSIYGTLFELFLPNQTWINNPLILLGSSTATIISYALFSSKYLDIKKLYKRWNIVLNIIIYLSILSFFLFSYTFIYSRLVATTFLCSILWTIIVYTTCTIPAFIKRTYHSKIFLLAYLCLIIGFVLIFLDLINDKEGYTIQYYLLAAIVAQVFILSLGIGKKMSSLRKEKENAKEKAMLQLEGKVTERTKELNEKKNILEIKNKEINDSINYAKRIQNAILPSTELIDESFSEKFILYLPKDIVAGDFYWLEKTAKSTLLAVADCTGHGVPGAMVSVVCYNALNKSVKEFNLTNPAQILDKTRELVIETFSKNSLGIKDGMDISLINYNSESKKLFYSGANNHLLIIRNNELLEYRADKQPIGMAESYTPFSNHEIDLIKNDVIYLFTDGYADQFGGENDKKLKSANFKKLLLKNNELKMEEQQMELLTFFNNWKNQTEQLDDVCVVGIKV